MADVSLGGVLMTGSGVGAAGAVTVSAVQDGYLAPTVTVGAEFYYVIKNDGGNNIEYGIGTWTATTPGIGVFSRAVIESTDGVGVGLTLTGNSFSVYMDVPLEKAVFVLSDGTVKNGDAIIKTIKVDSFAALAALAVPTNNNVLYQVKQGTSVNDGRGGFFEWVAGDTTAFDDHTADVTVNVIKLAAASTGRMFRRAFYADIFQAANATNQPLNTLATIGSGDAKNFQVKRSINSTEHDKKLPEVENFHQGEFTTFAQWKALSSTRWKSNDTFVFRGMLEEGDLLNGRLTFKWDASSTNTDALDRTHLRPDDISGGNAGRAVLVERGAITKFDDSDATPSVKLDRVFICADTVPAAITALDDIIAGHEYTILPGAQAQVFQHGSLLQCPNDTDYTLRVNGSPLKVVAADDGAGTVRAYLITGGGAGESLFVGLIDTTESALLDISDAINTTGKYAGKTVTTNSGRRIWRALGAATDSDWQPTDSGLPEDAITPA